MLTRDRKGSKTARTSSWRGSHFKVAFEAHSRPEALDSHCEKNPKPQLWDICPGCILWLPARREMIDKIEENNRLSREQTAFFEHPVMVLSVKVTSSKKATVTFAFLTSLGEKTPQERFPNRQGWWGKYVEICSEKTLPEERNASLSLEKNRQLAKRTYVDLEKGAYTIDYTALQCYVIDNRSEPYRNRLTKGSYEDLMGRLRKHQGFLTTGLETARWVETGRLWETFLEKWLPDQAKKAPEPKLKQINEAGNWRSGAGAGNWRAGAKAQS